MSAQTQAQELLNKADVDINGARPWDLQVNNERLFERIFAGGSLALGEAYVDGWWDAKALDQFFYHVLRVDLGDHLKPNLKLIFNFLRAKINNTQRKATAFEIGEHHYDIGNDLYQAMLGRTMAYTCGYWKNAKTLDEAQEAKLDLVCKKIGLKKGDRVLDVGGGWGSFAKFAAQKYGASVVAITVSKEQAELGKELCKGLPVEIRLQDYRDVSEQFDHIVSLGMFEHVGYKNYRTFMEVAHRSLREDGLFLLHTIGNNRSVAISEPWIDKYIFPNSMLPSIKQIGGSIENLFVMEDWHNFGADYDTTLMAWFLNFDLAWSKLKEKYSERFYRMWKYYLLSSAGLFRARKAQLWQIVLSKNGVLRGYTSVR